MIFLEKQNTKFGSSKCKLVFLEKGMGYMVNWVERREKLSVENFAEVEKILGVRLPQDYIDWFQQYNAIENRNAHILIDDEPYHFDEFYDLDEIPEEVEAWFEDDEELKETNLLVPFGFDSALNPYCFYYGQKREHPIIIWFSSDEAVSELFNGAELNLDLVRHVRPTFTEFINDLYVRTDY
jgi:hypothetical protein